MLLANACTLCLSDIFLNLLCSIPKLEHNLSSAVGNKYRDIARTVAKVMLLEGRTVDSLSHMFLMRFKSQNASLVGMYKLVKDHVGRHVADNTITYIVRRMESFSPTPPGSITYETFCAFVKLGEPKQYN